MPIYEYRCGACGHTLDALQKISDEPLSVCEACGAAALRRLMSAPAFRLKGKGWYETDFKSDKEKKRNLAGEGKEASKADAGGKSDSAGSATTDKASKESGTKAPQDSATKSTSKPSSSPEAA
jgi:putative FmdB family regulatory protein